MYPLSGNPQVCKLTPGIRVQFVPNSPEGKATSVSKDFVLLWGEVSVPLGPRQIVRYFKSRDGGPVNPDKFTFGRKYSLTPTCNPDEIVRALMGEF